MLAELTDLLMDKARPVATTGQYKAAISPVAHSIFQVSPPAL